MTPNEHDNPANVRGADRPQSSTRSRPAYPRRTGPDDTMPDVPVMEQLPDSDALPDPGYPEMPASAREYAAAPCRPPPPVRAAGRGPPGREPPAAEPPAVGTAWPGTPRRNRPATDGPSARPGRPSGHVRGRPSSPSASSSQRRSRPTASRTAAAGRPRHQTGLVARPVRARRARPTPRRRCTARRCRGRRCALPRTTRRPGSRWPRRRTLRPRRGVPAAPAPPPRRPPRPARRPGREPAQRPTSEALTLRPAAARQAGDAGRRLAAGRCTALAAG